MPTKLRVKKEDERFTERVELDAETHSWLMRRAGKMQMESGVRIEIPQVLKALKEEIEQQEGVINV